MYLLDFQTTSVLVDKYFHFIDKIVFEVVLAPKPYNHCLFCSDSYLFSFSKYWSGKIKSIVLDGGLARNYSRDKQWFLLRYDKNVFVFLFTFKSIKLCFLGQAEFTQDFHQIFDLWKKWTCHVVTSTVPLFLICHFHLSH